MNELKIDPRGLTIDRIDNSGNYEKGNIQFITHKENNQNRRKVYLKEAKNDQQTIIEQLANLTHREISDNCEHDFHIKLYELVQKARTIQMSCGDIK